MDEKQYAVYYLPYDHDAYGVGDIIPISDPNDHPVNLEGALDMIEDAKEEFQYEMEEQGKPFYFDDRDLFVIKEADDYDQSNWNTTKRVFSISSRAMEAYEQDQLLAPAQTVYLNQDGTSFLYNGYSQEDDLYRDYQIQALDARPEDTFTIVQENFPQVRGSAEMEWDSEIEQNTVWQEEKQTIPVQQVQEEQQNRIEVIRKDADWRKAKLNSWLENHGMRQILETDNLPEKEKQEKRSKMPAGNNRNVESFDRHVHEWAVEAEEVHRFDQVKKRAQASSGITGKVGGEAKKGETLGTADKARSAGRSHHGGK